MSGHSEEQSSHRWLAHSRAGFVVSAAAFAVPIALSVVSAFFASVLLPHPNSGAQKVLWWTSILALAWIAAVLGERIARPLLPLASLLKMSLLFPDRAPSRFAVAWRSGSTRQLDRYVHGLDDGVHREPVTAAVEILTLITALSSHDRRTRGHSERVRAYTDLIADELRLPPGDRDRLRWSALLHDVGKITVHADILNKAGKPSESEWEILRRHPLEGQRILEPLREWLGEWGLAVAQHHENFDGTGYPFGISGEQISLGARIVSVADAFEVMTSARSYKNALSPSDARKELTRCAGTQFDPAIVRAFLDISVGRQRWVIGPLAWLFDVPIVSQLSNVATMSSQVALIAGSVSLGAVAAAGQVEAHHSPHAHYPVALAAPRAKRQPEVVAVLSTTSIGVAGNVHGGATISHATRDTGGTVTYDVYRNNSCSKSSLVATLGPVSVTNGVVPDSPNWTAAGPAGVYYFVAAYGGDASDDASTSGCSSNPIRVVADSTTITLQLSATTSAIGGEIHASATITDTDLGAAGTVTYYVYRNDTCSSTGLVATLGTVTMRNGTVPNSSNWAAAGPAGNYYFVAALGGDASGKVIVSGCAAAPVTVSSASPAQPFSTPVANPGNPSLRPTPTTTTTKPTTPTTTTTQSPTPKSPAPTTTTARPTAPTTTTTKPTAPTTTTTKPTTPTTTTTKPTAPTTTTTQSCHEILILCLPL
jgi:HD-GYP domain-containing protein (c-di-GMP phosphodiesterase class II)